MKVSYINYHREFREFPTLTSLLPKHRFYFQKCWSGKLWYFGFRHHSICLDFRKDIFADLARKESQQRRKLKVSTNIKTSGVDK